MYKRLGLEKDLNLKARFLELLFLVSVLAVVFGPGPIDAYLLAAALGFTVFGLLLYAEIINGELPEDISQTMPVGFTFTGILALALRPTYTVSALPVAVLFMLSAGYIASLGLLSQRQFWGRFQQYTITDVTRTLNNLRQMNREELKKRIGDDRKNLATAFTISLVALTAAAYAFSQATGQTLTVSHAIETLIGTFVSTAFLDRWVLGE